MNPGTELIGAVYLPILLAAAGWAAHRRRPIPFAPILLSLLWTLTALLALQLLNRAAGWWSFPAAELPIGGMPVALWLGWTLLWGLVPSLCFPRLPLPLAALILIAVDLLGMPLCGAVVHLGPRWLAGEAVAVTIVLLPGLALARGTLRHTHLRLRAAAQVLLAAALFLFLLPEVLFTLRPGSGWAPLLALPGWALQIIAQLMLLLALPGLSAVQEFAARGNGTPIPYDPPQHLVTSGIYRFLRNPMQLSAALVLLLWALVLHSLWIAAAAAGAFFYGAGLAEWDEAADLQTRFAQPWLHFRAHVPNWIPRWTPFVAFPSTVYMAQTCAVCQQLRLWIEARHPHGLCIEHAETLPAGSIQRMRYLPADGSPPEEGVRALARVLEHLNLPWALLGMLLRLPGLAQAAQLLADICGFGPRDLTTQANSSSVCGLQGHPHASPRI